METTLAQQIAAVEEIAKYEIKGTTEEDGKLFSQALKDAAQSLYELETIKNQKK